MRVVDELLCVCVRERDRQTGLHRQLLSSLVFFSNQFYLQRRVSPEGSLSGTAKGRRGREGGREKSEREREGLKTVVYPLSTYL